jgi:threonylcarbamoyladenosine tRNA methylthiotransferase CDKAL1
MDIEDLIGAPERDITPSIIAPNKIRKHKQVGSKKDEDSKTTCGKQDESCTDKMKHSIVPGTATIYIKTFGCAHNMSDSEYMQGILESYGYNFTTDEKSADLWLLNR